MIATILGSGAPIMNILTTEGMQYSWHSSTVNGLQDIHDA